MSWRTVAEGNKPRTLDTAPSGWRQDLPVNRKDQRVLRCPNAPYKCFNCYCTGREPEQKVRKDLPEEDLSLCSRWAAQFRYNAPRPIPLQYRHTLCKQTASAHASWRAVWFRGAGCSGRKCQCTTTLAATRMCKPKSITHSFLSATHGTGGQGPSCRVSWQPCLDLCLRIPASLWRRLLSSEARQRITTWSFDIALHPWPSTTLSTPSAPLLAKGGASMGVAAVGPCAHTRGTACASLLSCSTLLGLSYTALGDKLSPSACVLR